MMMKRGAAVSAVLVVIVLMLSAFTLDVDNKDKVAIFKDIEVPKETTSIGDAVAIFGNIAVDGTLTGDVVAIFGNISAAGTIDGDVVSIFGNISVKDKGVISGDVVGILGNVDKAPYGIIRGEIADISVPFEFGRRNTLIPRISLGDMIGLFAIYAFSCLALLIAPDRVKLMSEESRLSLGRRFGIGFVIMLTFVPVSIVLSILFAITLIGIVFIPFIFIAFVLVAFAGMVAVQIAIGHRITGHLEGRNAMYIHLLVGIVIVFVLKVVPILGWLAYLALVTYAIGVAADTRLGSPKPRKQAPNA